MLPNFVIKIKINFLLLGGVGDWVEKDSVGSENGFSIVLWEIQIYSRGWGRGSRRRLSFRRWGYFIIVLFTVGTRLIRRMRKLCVR